MGRLIDADILKEKLDELEPYIDCDENSTTWILSDEVYNAVDNAPTVELTEAEVQETLSKRCMTAVANEYLMDLITSKGKTQQSDLISKEKVLKILCEKCPVCNCVSACNSYRSIEKM